MRRFLPVLPLLAAALALPASAPSHERSASATAALESYFDATALEAITDREALPDPQPLTGTGANMRIVANVPITEAGGVAASDLELAGDYAYVGSYGEGMVIIDISDPRKPRRAGVFNCPGGQNDIQLQPGTNPQYAVMAIESTSNKCHANNEGFVVIDISNKAAPREVAFVGQTVPEGGLQDGSHNTTMDWPYLYNDQYQPTHGNQEGRRGQVDIFDLRKVIAGDKKPIAVLEAPGGGAHDMQIDHRPDGKALAYAASIGFTDVIDVTDPTKPKFLQRLSAAEHGVGISHGAEPNFDRTLMIETDEYGGGSGVGACGGASDARVPPQASGIVNTGSPGAVHLLRLAPDGKIKTLDPTGASPKVDQVGAYNIPPSSNGNTDDGCTSHVFWQAPNENRMTIAWYGRGTRIFDFSKPDAPVELGHFIPTGSETWAAKPHKGYIFTGDTARGMDVLEYTGENCARWPTTSGAAEVQRARYQSEPVPADAPKATLPGCGGKATNDPIVALRGSSNPQNTQPGPPPSSSAGGGSGSATQPRGGSSNGAAAGGYRFVRAVKVPRTRSGRRTLRVQILNAAGKVVATARYRVRSGRRARLRLAVGGPSGRYRYRILAGKRTVGRGAFTVKAISRVRVAGATAQRVRIARLKK